MKKGLLIVLLLLLLGGNSSAEVQVFFVPESGFLRVQAEVAIHPAIASPSFMLFPGVQITELWADELWEYNVERSQHGTMVSMSLRQVRPQVLSLAYEGFLDLEGSTLLLDRNTLWFPEFSFPVEEAAISVNLPENWEIVDWPSQLPMYPSLLVRDHSADEAGDVQPIVPVMDEFTSRLQMQLARLTNAMNQRNATEIEALLSPALKDTGLARYLASIPPSQGSVTSELKDPFTVIFKTGRGNRYQASVLWQESSGRLELQSFQMTPQGAQMPEELFVSVQRFAEDLRLFVQTKQRDQILQAIEPGIAQGQEEIAEFLLSLNGAEMWTVTLTEETVDPFTVTLLVPQSETTTFLLYLGLTPGTTQWLIQSLQIIPVG